MILHEKNKTCHNVVLEVVVLEVGNGWKLMKGGYHGKKGHYYISVTDFLTIHYTGVHLDN